MPGCGFSKSVFKILLQCKAMNGQKYNFKGCKERISVITSHARGSEHFDEKLLFPFYFLNFFTVLMSEKTGCPGA
jgi:hypothetical protein